MNQAELLDSESWDAVLETYAHSVNVALALLDHDGVLVGRVHNPKTIWSLVRTARPDWDGCPFCLDGEAHCTAISDAMQTRSLVMVSGLGGFAHTATPIFLEDKHLGTLLAGQVFDQYPDLLLLEQVARKYGLSGQQCWELARQQVPVSRTALRTYGDLLGTLGHAYLEQRRATILQRELADSNRKLLNVNSQLLDKVAELDQSLAEKDILLNEVHHRVNNNLAVIGSLLRLQAASFPDHQVADALRESQLRVESMALIHAHLYNSVDWRAVDFATYVTTLAEQLFRAYGVDRSRIQLRVEIGPLQLGVDKAIPAGLILNELISNALKHAFPGGRQGSVSIGGDLWEGRVRLFVQDDGVGMAGSVEPISRQRVGSLGMKIMNILCHQLKGAFEPPQQSAEPDAGSIFRLSFPHEKLSAAAVSSGRRL